MRFLVEHAPPASGNSRCCGSGARDQRPGRAAPGVRRRRSGRKSRRQNANQGKARAVKFERLTDEAGVAAESSLPKAVGDDRDTWSARAVIFRCERAPNSRAHAKCLEQVCRNPQAIQAFYVPAASHVRVPTSHGRDGIQGGGVVAIVEEVWKRKRSIVAVRAHRSNPERAVRMSEGELPQENSVDDAEQRGVCANSQGQREHGHGQKSWPFHQRARAAMNVVQECSHLVITCTCSRASSTSARQAGMGVRKH